MINLEIIIIGLVLLGIIWALLRQGQISNTKFSGGRRGASDKDIVKDLSKHPRTKSEQYAIELLEQITGKKFPTVNPGWLKFEGKSLELDGYNEELKLALEFSGPMHRKWFPEKESYEKYLDRVEKDAAKKRICKEKGIFLMELDSELPKRHWKTYIMSRLKDSGFLEHVYEYLPVQDFEIYKK